MVLIRSTSERQVIDHMIDRIGFKRSWMDSLGFLLPSSRSRSRSRSSSNSSCNRRRRRKSPVAHNHYSISSSSSSYFNKKIRLSSNNFNVPSLTQCYTNKQLTTPDWSELPQVLLAVIINKLTSIKDCICFGAVSISWQHIYRHYRPHLPPQLPMLAIPHHQRRTLTLFSPFTCPTRRRRRMVMFDSDDLRVPPNSQCIGSSQGWLIFLENVHIPGSIRLLNPFLSASNDFRLPPPPSPGFYKVVLSANPASTSDYIVAGFSPNLLAFCRPGDKAWTIVKSTLVLEDIIYYKNQFYTVDVNATVMAFDCCTLNPVLRFIANSPPEFGMGYDKIYLVESSGDLLLVVREVDCFGSLETHGFNVYKMDPNKPSWNEVKTLDGCILFLGGISSMSVLASHFPGCCKPNSIYFGYDIHYLRSWDYPLDSGVFNLDDGSFERHVRPKCNRGSIWIEPKLQAC